MKKLIVAFSFALTCITGAAQRLIITYDTAWFFTDSLLEAPGFDKASLFPNTQAASQGFTVSHRSILIDIDAGRIFRGEYNQLPDCDVLDDLFYFPLEIYQNVMCYYATCDGDYREIYYLVTPLAGYVNGDVTLCVGYFEEDGAYYGYHSKGKMVVENYTPPDIGP